MERKSISIFAQKIHLDFYIYHETPFITLNTQHFYDSGRRRRRVFIYQAYTLFNNSNKIAFQYVNHIERRGFGDSKRNETHLDVYIIAFKSQARCDVKARVKPLYISPRDSSVTSNNENF